MTDLAAAGHPAPPPLLATHFGNQPQAQGAGISTVLALYRQGPSTGLQIRTVTTYVPSARLLGPYWFLGSLWAALTGRPRRLGVVHVHLSMRGSFLREGAVLVLARLRGLPTCATIHGSGFVGFSARHPRLTAAVLRRADRIVTLSDDVHQQVHRLLPQAHLVRMHNPVRCADGPDEVDLRPPVVAFGGVLSRRKGLDVLLAAWPAVVAAVPAARLQVMGPPGDVPVPDDPTVHQTGLLDPAEVQQVLRTSRVAVLPSRAEVQPMFLLEAMEAGAAVVSTQVGGIPAMLGDTGLLVPAGDADALSAALIALLSDAEAARDQARRARCRVRASHRVESVIQELESVYRTMQTPDRGVDPCRSSNAP